MKDRAGFSGHIVNHFSAIWSLVPLSFHETGFRPLVAFPCMCQQSLDVPKASEESSHLQPGTHFTVRVPRSPDPPSVSMFYLDCHIWPQTLSCFTATTVISLFSSKDATNFYSRLNSVGSVCMKYTKPENMNFTQLSQQVKGATHSCLMCLSFGTKREHRQHPGLFSRISNWPKSLKNEDFVLHKKSLRLLCPGCEASLSSPCHLLIVFLCVWSQMTQPHGRRLQDHENPTQQ